MEFDCVSLGLLRSSVQVQTAPQKLFENLSLGRYTSELMSKIPKCFWAKEFNFCFVFPFDILPTWSSRQIIHPRSRCGCLNRHDVRTKCKSYNALKEHNNTDNWEVNATKYCGTGVARGKINLHRLRHTTEDFCQAYRISHSAIDVINCRIFWAKTQFSFRFFWRLAWLDRQITRSCHNQTGARTESLRRQAYVRMLVPRAKEKITECAAADY